MSFNKSSCIIRKIYCGNGNIPKNTKLEKYSRKGSLHECLKKGYGLAQAEINNKNLSNTNLKQIKYIGPVYEDNFKKYKIKTINSLIKKMNSLSANEKKNLLNKILLKSNNTIDQKAINSILLFLDEKGVKNLPSCKIVKE